LKDWLLIIRKYFSEIKPKVVIHLAAVSHANRSNKDPHSTFDHSLRTLENALDNAKNRIEHLEITRVRSFDNISNISNFTELKSLVLEDNIKLKAIEFNNEFSKLTDLKIINCKTFNSLVGLEKLTSLNSLTIYKTDLDFEKIIINKDRSLAGVSVPAKGLFLTEVIYPNSIF